MPVYVDVLITTNFIIDYLLLCAVNKIVGRSTRRLRSFAAALLGALSTLTIFLPFLGLVWEVVIKIAVSAAMVLIANKWRTTVQFLKEWLTFFTASFLFGGVMLAVWVTLNPKNMFYYNGVVYFNVSALFLLIAISGAYFLLSVFDRFVKKSFVGKGTYRVTISLLGKEKTLIALLDTGNSLRDPFTGAPVVVCSYEAVRDILPAEVWQSFNEEGSFFQESFLKWDQSLRERFRMIPYRAVGVNGVIPALKADELRLNAQGCESTVEQVYVAISPQKIGDGTYGMLLSPELMENKTRKVETAV